MGVILLSHGVGRYTKITSAGVVYGLPAGKPVVLRKVMKKDFRGRAKIVRDRRLNIDVEMIRKAVLHHPCHACADSVCPDESYFIVNYREHLRRVGKNMVPTRKNFHPHCLPTILAPCLRFFE